MFSFWKKKPVVETPAVEIKPKESFFKKLFQTRESFISKLTTLFTGNKELISEDLLENIKMMLLTSDLGPKLTDIVIGELEVSIKKDNIKEISLEEVKVYLKNILLSKVNVEITNQVNDSKPRIILIVGVNGVGKTTTSAKIAANLKSEGEKVLLVAADTFRAGAVTQLKVWGERSNIEVISGAENAKPQSVVFDAMTKAKEENFDIVLIDTAGRLHNKSNLMQELSGIRNIVVKHFENEPSETLLVLDGTTGQNMLSQAKEFNDVTKLTGFIVTKLDGSAKGGAVLAVQQELSLPVRYIGVGEQVEDLRAFNAEDYIEGIIG